MTRPQDTKTNAADTAPGVNDGKVRGRGMPVNSKPGGRGLVALIVGVSLAILAIVFIARPDGTGESNVQTSPDGGAMPNAPAPQTDQNAGSSR
ncbi:hypothetical protein [Phenylobacterium sp.]|uniref:hypothetical protein n=1 Tax=Phenylobacterium sp. TaxID=1871053 RepID=UPI002E3008DF|nr:hypothetical protein [Phenylobacterium sp.]HEX2559120.1 hypothetical protein [Phenylobacterium sp.]